MPGETKILDLGPGTRDPRTRGPKDWGPKDQGPNKSNSVALSFYDRNATCVNVLLKLKCTTAESLWVTESALLYTQ